jgi:hypothetical protein
VSAAKPRQLSLQVLYLNVAPVSVHVVEVVDEAVQLFSLLLHHLTISLQLQKLFLRHCFELIDN